MLVELSMVEQRYKRSEVLDTGATITTSLLVTRGSQDAASLVDRYASAVSKRSRPSRPSRHVARQMDPVIEARLVSLRRSHRAGARTLTTKLRQEFDHAPARSSVYRASCATNSLSRSSENVQPPVTDDSSALSQWRCGRWTWSVGSTSRTAPSCTA